MRSQDRKWRWGAPCLLVAILSLAACGGEPVPTAQMNEAKRAVTRAQEDGAAAVAPAPLQMAQDKLNRAHGAAGNDNTQARRWAEQAEADAEFADTTTLAQRAQTALNELQSTPALRQAAPPR